MSYIIKPFRAPSQIVLEFYSQGQKCVKIGKLYKSVLLVQIIHESERAAWIAESGHVLDERDLHLCALQKHACVPLEAWLLFKKGNLGTVVTCIKSLSL
jgi:hypothetical protein